MENEKVIIVQKKPQANEILFAYLIRMLIAFLLILKPLIININSKTLTNENAILITILFITFMYLYEICIFIIMTVYIILINITSFYNNVFKKENNEYINFVNTIRNFMGPTEILENIILKKDEISFVYLHKNKTHRTTTIIKNEITSYKITATLNDTPNKSLSNYLLLDITLKNDKNIFLDETILPSNNEELLYDLIDIGHKLPNFELKIEGDRKADIEKFRNYSEQKKKTIL